MSFLPGDLPGVFAPLVRSCFSQLWRYFAGGHISFGRSFSFQGASVIYKYSLAKKEALSRISKRLEKSEKITHFVLLSIPMGDALNSVHGTAWNEDFRNFTKNQVKQRKGMLSLMDRTSLRKF